MLLAARARAAAREWARRGAGARPLSSAAAGAGEAAPALKGRHVAVVGAGQIGAACARGLLRNGWSVSVHDPSERNRADLERLGAKWHARLDDLAEAHGRSGDVLVTALPAPPHVRKVMEEAALLERLRPGSFWVDHTTTDPKEAMRLHGKARAKGVHSLEAPLTGGYELLQRGMMTVLVGGRAEVLAVARPVIKSYTETILLMGDLGTASHVKIITNQLAAVHLIAAGEAAMMAKKHGGIDMEAFFDGVRASAGNSYVFETETPLFFNQTFDPGFTIDLHIKDLSIGREIHTDKGRVADYDKAYRLHALGEQMYRETQAKYGPKVGSSSPGRMIQDDLATSLAAPGWAKWGYTIEKVRGGSIGVVHINRENDPAGPASK
jgi:3-hydroxyisobutyrate dehydrogenase